MHRCLVLLLLVVLPLGSACLNECSFWERCDGNILQRCGDGPDHLIGRKIRAQPCAEPNPLCVEIAEHAFCVAAPLQTCDTEHVDYCDGTRRTSCLLSDGEGYVTQQDCSSSETDAGPASCVDSEDGGVRCE